MKNNVFDEKTRTSACIGCVQCERVCPRYIPVIKWLKEAAKRFEIERT